MVRIDERKASISDVLRFLIGVDYPASRERLIHHAKSREAPDPVLETLGALPEREYENAAEVDKALGKL